MSFQRWISLLLIGLLSLLVFSACASQRPPGTELYEDFSDPSTHWARSADETGTTDYTSDGRYLIQVNPAYYALWGNTGTEYSNVSVKVDAQAGTETDGEMGLICRQVDDQNFYYFVIRPDARFAAVKIVGGEEQLMHIGQDEEAIHSGLESNQLRLDCVDSHLSFYVNDALLVEISDPGFSSGDVGLIAGTNEEENMQAYFDNLTISLVQ